MDKLSKSKEWTEILKAKGWDDSYLSGDAFAKFLADDQVRTKDVLMSVGLVKLRLAAGTESAKRRTRSRRFFFPEP